MANTLLRVAVIIYSWFYEWIFYQSVLFNLFQVNKSNKTSDRSIVITNQHIYKLDPKKKFKLMKQGTPFLDVSSFIIYLLYFYCISITSHSRYFSTFESVCLFDIKKKIFLNAK